MPLGLLNLAAILDDRYNVIIYKPVHKIIESKDYTIVANAILKSEPTLIGFSTWCISYPAILFIAREIKQINPEIPILFGGPQASILARETMKKFPFVDYILTGEADQTAQLFLQETEKPAPQFDKVPALVYRDKNGMIKQNKSLQPVQNLDELPVPSYHLFPELKIIKLDVGRGCPFNCTYCSTNEFFSKRYRTKSVDRIIHEMILVNKQRKIKDFGFTHDMLTMNKKFVFKLCDQLIKLRSEKGLHFNWACSARIDCVTNEMMVQMKQAGCHTIFFGIETGSEQIQKSIKKNLDLSTVIQVADICRELNINMFASFILGFPEETKADVGKTLGLILKLALKGAFVQSSELSLLPGTPIFGAYKNQLEFDGNFSNFSFTWSTEDEIKLISQYPDMFSSFYHLPVKTLSRPQIIFLSAMINQMNRFRNTFFLLSHIVEDELVQENPLELFKAYYSYLDTENLLNEPPIAQWIRIISAFIGHYKKNIDTPFITDVFNFESTVAILLTIFIQWQINHKSSNYKASNDDFLIKPTPFWKTMQTNYKIEKIMPSVNGWNRRRNKCRRGNYHYLLVASSAVKCRKIPLKKQEVFLFENLSVISYSNFKEKVRPVLSEKETFSWIKKMRNLGVVEFSPL